MLIAGAGGAAHLPGMAAAKTALPVLGVPVETKTLKGMDSLLSIVQMPAGVPVGTLAIGRAGAVNAALLAAAILARSRRGDPRLGWPRTGQTRRSRCSPPPTRRREAAPAVTLVACIGGGQLGPDARARGYPARARFRFLDPSPERLRGAVGELVVGRLRRPGALERLAAGADVVTYEFENVSVEAASQPRPLPPPFGRSSWVRTGSSRSSCSGGSGSRRPGSARSPRQGSRRSSSRGGSATTARVNGASMPKSALGEHELAEELIAFERELSIIAVRGRDGETRFWPLAENVHRDGDPPGLASAGVAAPQAEAEELARRLLDELGYVGVLALELFEVDGELLANEFAPRVHNTGHWTIDGAATSQFENHLRAILGLPLGSTGRDGARP